jgi:hypothetical protein
MVALPRLIQPEWYIAIEDSRKPLRSSAYVAGILDQEMQRMLDIRSFAAGRLAQELVTLCHVRVFADNLATRRGVSPDNVVLEWHRAFVTLSVF